MRYSVLFLFLFIYSFNYSQKGTLTGKVTDENGESLVGASIIYRGDITVGASTDIEGNYTIQLPVGENTLICRFTNKITDTFSVVILENQLTEHDIVLKDYENYKEFEGVNIRVGKFDKRPEDITVSLEIIKPELIEAKNTRSVETILDQTPGLNILDGEPQIRGGSGFTFGVGSKVAVIVDDMPLLSGDAGRPEWSFIPVENIKQIEVVKGAGSVLSGSSALSGAIHIRTKYPTTKPLTKVNIYSGLYSQPEDTAQIWRRPNPFISGVNFLHSRIIGNWDVVIGGNFNYDQGYIGPPVQDPYIEESFPDTISNFSNADMTSKRARLNFNLRHRSKKMRGLFYGLNGNAMISESPMIFAWLNDTSGLFRGYPGAVFLQEQTIFNLDPFVQLKLESGSSHKLRGRFLYTDNNITANQSNNSLVYYGDYQFQRTYKQLSNLEFIGGLSGNYTDSYAELYAGSGTPDNNLLNLSGYVQIEKQFLKIINISVGGRMENFQLNDTITDIQPIFRAGGNIKLHQETYLRMSYGQGYRFPTITERFIQTGVGNFGVFPNPDLKPETSSNSEVGIKQGLKFGNLYGYLDIAGFWQEYDNTIEYLFGFWDLSSPVGAGFKFLNTGRSRIIGLDVSFSGQAKIGKKNKISFLTGYNYILPKTLNPDLIYAVDSHPVNPREYSFSNTSLNPDRNILKYRFLHNIKGDISWTYAEKLSIGFSVKYFSQIENLDAVIAEFEENTAVVSTIQNIRYMDYFEANRHGNWIFDARISYDINGKHKIAVISSNISNNMYSLRPLKMEAPRTVMIQYSLKLGGD
ncbi:MAG: TonB-dependent receptor [Brumimicrobium sp.]|nr:TonB-dependent receptor [Brumimicrobium sp.]